jgi:hypothetical protein
MEGRGFWIRARIFVCVVLAFLFSATSSESARDRRPCEDDLASCPAWGCESRDSPHGLVNQVKRSLPSGNRPTRLVFRDFARLQHQTNRMFGQAKDLELTASQRQQMRELLTNSGPRVSEGDLVEIVGYVIGLPHRPKASGPESVNCRIAGVENNDFHIPLADDPDDTEYEGIVVEMIPQNRNEGWTTRKLRLVAKEQRPIAVRGQLFYDNRHLVNDDPEDDEELRSEPKRFSLWEVHPVTEFWVCMTKSKKCNESRIAGPQWKRIESLQIVDRKLQ